MGIFDKLKAAADDVTTTISKSASEAKTMVGGLAAQHGDAVVSNVEKAASFVDEKTGGKLGGVTEKVGEFTEKAVDGAKGLGDAPGEAPGEAPKA